MFLSSERLLFNAYIHEQDDDAWPRPVLGLGYCFFWFRKYIPLRRDPYLPERIEGPCINLYIFFGRKYLALGLEWRTKSQIEWGNVYRAKLLDMESKRKQKKDENNEK